MRRDRVQIHGIAEYRSTGTVMAFEDGSWRIDDDEGRSVYASADQSAVDIHVGDRVEFEPAPVPINCGFASKQSVLARST
jgi:hypothetical protein